MTAYVQSIISQGRRLEHTHCTPDIILVCTIVIHTLSPSKDPVPWILTDLMQVPLSGIPPTRASVYSMSRRRILTAYCASSRDLQTRQEKGLAPSLSNVLELAHLHLLYSSSFLPYGTTTPKSLAVPWISYSTKQLTGDDAFWRSACSSNMKTAFKSTLRHDSLITSKNPSLPMIAPGGAMPPPNCTTAARREPQYALPNGVHIQKQGQNCVIDENAPAATGIARDLQG